MMFRFRNEGCELADSGEVSGEEYDCGLEYLSWVGKERGTRRKVTGTARRWWSEQPGLLQKASCRGRKAGVERALEREIQQVAPTAPEQVTAETWAGSHTHTVQCGNVCDSL